MKTCHVLIIGDELLAGEIVDRNGPMVSRCLAGEGFRVSERRTLPDQLELIAAALQEALKSATLVILCGGLGPTSDDVTTDAVASALGLGLELHEPSWAAILQLFQRRGRVAPRSNRKQALVPRGATVLDNKRGTAPGYALRVRGGAVLVLPGPPRENRPMLEGPGLAWLRGEGLGGEPLDTRIFRCFGGSESKLGELLRPFEEAWPMLRVGYQARMPEILVKLRGEPGQAAVLDRAQGELQALLGQICYGLGDEPLPTVLGRALERRGLALVTAESCTAGLAAKLLTDAPGSSAWFERGMVVYSNEAKEELLGVARALLEKHGAVSEPVARAMVQGALERSRADVGLSITGIAGPGGGSEAKPVGTVWLGWGNRREVHAERIHCRWDREHVRIISAWSAFRRLLSFLR